MYLDFYQMHLKPFQISTDPRFLWLGEKHEEALSILQYAIRDNRGFLLLTGDVGTGKTTLLNALIDGLRDDVRVAMVTDPGLAKLDFFNFIADAFNLDRTFRSKGQFLIFMKKFLLDLRRQNQQALLIIDESQNLNQTMLEEVRLLSNIETATAKLINIFFVGQIEFNDIILRPRNRAIRQRITVNYNISTLNEAETDSYIRYRLKVAGSTAPIFTPDAVSEVYKFSNGYPRLINIICDQALLTGYVRERKQIGSAIVAECAAELKIAEGMAGHINQAIPETDLNPSPAQTAGPPPTAPAAEIHGKTPLRFSIIMVVAILLVLLIGLEASLFRNRQQSRTPPTIEGAASTKEPSAATETPASGPPSAGSEPANPAAQGDRPPDAAQEADAPSIEASAGDGSAAPARPRPSEATEKSAASGDETPLSSPVAVAPIGNGDADTGPTLADIKKVFGEYPEIKFALNSNTLNNEAYYLLGAIARFVSQQPATALILWGYTDRSGVRNYNLKLAEFRADMVKTYLVGKGVPADSITTMAVGPDPEGPAGTTVPYDDDRRKVIIEIIAPES